MENLIRSNMHNKAKMKGIINLIILCVTEALIYFIPPNGRTYTK